MASGLGCRKIVFITEDIFGESVGGVEQHIFHVARELARSGHKLSIISMKAGHANRRVEEYLFDADSSVKLIKFERKVWFFSVFQFLEHKVPGALGLVVALVGKLLPNFFYRDLVREVRSIKPDLVHQHDYLANMRASKELARFVPVIFTNHTGQYLFLEKFNLTRKVQRYLLRHYAAIIGPSRELTPNDPRASYIPNGVDTDFFLPPAKLRTNRPVVFICPRRWAPTKGVLYLARALSIVDENLQKNMKVLFAGSESNDYMWYRDQVLEALSRVPSDIYELLGNLNQEDLKCEFQRANVVVIPSLMEATSLAAMEGMACGIPVLSTNVGGMPDVVDVQSGWLVEPADPEALAKEIEHILLENYDLSEMGNLARDFVHEYRSWKKIANQVEQVYGEVLSA